MRAQRRSALRGLAGLAALSALAASCGGGGEPPRGLQHLLQEGTPATLGHETRLATGPAGAILLHRRFEGLHEVPASLALEGDLAGSERVLLDAQSFLLRAPGARVERRRAASAVPVLRGEGGARVSLRELRGRIGHAPLTLHVTGFPVAGASETVRLPATLPGSGGFLAFGYGLREEGWDAGGGPVTFAAALAGPDGERRELWRGTVDPADPAQRRWHDARVPLPGPAGERATIELSWSREAPDAGLPVFSDPVVAPGGDAPPRPSLLIVSVDTLRARSLRTWGYTRDTAPFLDSLARRSTWFSNAITASVTTGPSHMSLFTGRYPVHHGMLVGLEHVAAVPTLAEILRGAGYCTAAFTEDGFLVRRRGFGRGFARYTENPGDADHPPGEAERTFAQAGAWLADNHQQPFFLFVHTYEVHAPFTPEPRNAELFAGDGAPGPADPVLRRERDDYEREIRGLDEALRSLFEAVDARAARGPLIAVVLSDHGEEFAEHGLFQHGGAVYEETLRVPLLFWGPGLVPEGRRVDALVSLVDVAPTVLELLGVDAPPGLDGTSLVPVLRGDGALPERTLFAEARAPNRWRDPLTQERWNPPLVAVLAGDSKFIVHRPAEGEAQPTVRYDLGADPDESAPIAPEPAERSRVETLVDRYLEGAAAPGPTEAPLPDLDERLRSLGYVE